MKKIEIISKTMFFLLIIFTFSCSPKQNQKNEQKNIEIVEKLNDTNSVEKRNIIEETKVNIDSIPFAFIAYGKYIVLPFSPEESWITEKFEKLGDNYAKIFLCNVDNNLLPDEIRNFIGKDFYISLWDDSSLTVKIKNIKILLQASPHFGTLQEAEESENPDKVILDYLWGSGGSMVVGEIDIQDSSIFPIWAFRYKENNYKSIKYPENSEVTKETVNRILKELDWKKENIESIYIEFQTNTQKYIFAILDEIEFPCGGDEEYHYKAFYIIRIDENNNIQLLESLGEVNHIETLDLFNDGNPEFIFENTTDEIFLIETEFMLDEEVKKIPFPYYDCGC
jgi:hypothetical protein